MENTFEAKLKRLEEIVNILDEGIISLEESINLYKEGMELTIELKRFLNQAELTIINLNEMYKKQMENDLSDE